MTLGPEPVTAVQWLGMIGEPPYVVQYYWYQNSRVMLFYDFV